MHERVVPIPDVCDVTYVRGARARTGAPPDLLVEIPHGATRAAHFDALAARLGGPFPDDLRAFFFVNTDVGAPEVGVRFAERVVAADASRSAVVVRALVPRTFVDLNRAIDTSLVAAQAAPGMTPGIAPYVRAESDLRLLLERYAAYRDVVDAAFAWVCGAGGTGVMLHSYAPRSVDVAVDEHIVRSLRDAYRPERVCTWPLRAEIDLITRDGAGRLLADGALVAALRARCGDDGIAPVENEAYFLHEATLAARFAARHAGRTLCLEMRRDLLVREFTPFAEMEIDAARADAMAARLADALLARWTA